MGISEWGFLIRNKSDLDHVIEIVKRHNTSKDVGEPLEIYAVFKHESDLYLCSGNCGGRDSTSDFLAKHYTGPLIYWPFDKPEWWYETKDSDYVWKQTDS